MTKAHVFVSGIVQGVYFRYHAAENAAGLGLAGWVRNLRDGRVEMILEGEKTRVDQMIEWCRKGPPGASVRSVDVIPEEYAGEFTTFEIRH